MGHLKLVSEEFHQDFSGSQDPPFTFYHFTILSQVQFSPMTLTAHIPDGNEGEIVRKMALVSWPLSPSLLTERCLFCWSSPVFPCEPLITIIFSTCSRTLKVQVLPVLVAHKL